MFVVRFIRNDGHPDEEYWYHRQGEAEYHFHLFDDDESELYLAIQLCDESMLLTERIVGFSPEDCALICKHPVADQISICEWLREQMKTEPEEQKQIDLLLLRLKIEKISYGVYPRFVNLVMTFS